VPPARPSPSDVLRAGDVLDQRPIPRLWRSRSNRVVAGVLGGLAEKFGWEPRPLRLLYGLITVGTMGAALIPYLAVWSITRARGSAPPMPPLWRSRTNRVVGGVLGGLAERWGINATVLRGVYASITIATGGVPGILTYLVLWTATRPLDDAAPK
jgi:phage shock protein PspC (stress-responsive transcriptional regulator)